MGSSDEKLRIAATNAAAVIASFYEWIDRIEANGGTASLSGIASCHAFVESMKKNRRRVDDLILKSVSKAIESRPAR